MSVIYWTPCDLTEDPALNEKYRDDVTRLVDELYEDEHLHYEIVPTGEDDEVALGLYCSEERHMGASGFYRNPFMTIISSMSGNDGLVFLPDFKYYLVDYYRDDHQIVDDLAKGVLDHVAPRHIFQELMYRIVEGHNEYSIELNDDACIKRHRSEWA